MFNFSYAMDFKMKNLITFLMIFHFSVTFAQQASEYKGTSYQNVKLFKVRPDLRGKSFAERKRGWTQEFGGATSYGYKGTSSDRYTVTIKTSPGKATVYWNGSYVGKTPIYDFEVNGENSIYTISKPGYKTEEGTWKANSQSKKYIISKVLEAGRGTNKNTISRASEIGNKTELYTGSIDQNLKLFAKRPDLRGTGFSMRMLAWEDEFGRSASSFSKSSPLSWKKSKETRYPSRSKEKKLLSPSYEPEIGNRFSFKDLVYWSLGGYGSYLLRKEGYVVLGNDILLGLLARQIYKRNRHVFRNNLNELEIGLEYYPMGTSSASPDIIAGETGQLRMKVKNMSGTKSVRKIDPYLRLNNSLPLLKQIKVEGGSKSISGKYSLKPYEEMVTIYNLTTPSIFDESHMAFEGGILDDRTGRVSFNVLDSPDPPDMQLVINELLDDDGNGILDGLESAEILGYLENHGKGPARGVKVLFREEPNNIRLHQSTVQIGDILPGEQKSFKIKMTALRTTVDGTEKLSLFANDIKGNEAPPRFATITTAKFLPPKIKMVNWTINDGRIGMANGNENNLVENGESVEIILNLENVGEGPAYGSKLDVSVSGMGVFPIKKNQFIGAIAPGASVMVPVGFSVPTTYDKKNFKFNVDVSDDRGVISFKESVAVECSFRTPRLSFDYLVHDGTTPGSEGNSNGLFEQGEKIELEIIPMNNGDLNAEDVTLTVSCSNPGITIRSNRTYGSGKNMWTIGNLPAKSTGRSQLIPLQVRYSAKTGEFKIDISLEQANFDGIKEKITTELYELVGEEIALGARSAAGFGRGGRSITSDYINVDIAPNLNKSMKDGFAVVIGNRNYDNRDIPQVDYADRDSRTFKSYLINSFGMSPGSIIEKNDAKLSDFNRIFGTKDNNKGQLYKQVQRLGKGAKVYVFYSGHGAPDLNDNRAFIVPTGSSMDNIQFEGYPLDLLLGNLSKLPAENVTLVMDACFSGKSENGMLYKQISPTLLKVKTPGVVRGLNVFSSSENDQVSSWYPKARHGVFSYYFFAGLQGLADTNGDRKITNGEMESYLAEMVPEKVNELSNFGREQDPTFVGKKNVVLLELD